VWGTRTNKVKLIAYRVSLRQPEGKRPLGRPRRRFEDNIKMDLGEIGWGGVDWINLVQDRDWWNALVNKVMNLRWHKMLGNSWLAERLAASQDGLSSTEMVGWSCPITLLADKTDICTEIFHSPVTSLMRTISSTVYSSDKQSRHESFGRLRNVTDKIRVYGVNKLQVSYGYDRQHNNKAEYLLVTTKTDADPCMPLTYLI
jgi:hypothetical protein